MDFYRFFIDFWVLWQFCKYFVDISENICESVFCEFMINNRQIFVKLRD